MTITKRSLRTALETTDAGLAKFFGVTPSAVSQWEEEDELPMARQWQAKALRPDLFGPAPKARKRADARNRVA